LYVRCINRKKLVLRRRGGFGKIQPKRVDSEMAHEVLRTQASGVKLEKEREFALAKQAYFNQLPIGKKREWFGKLRKNFIDFKVKRKYVHEGYSQDVWSRPLYVGHRQGDQLLN